MISKKLNISLVLLIAGLWLSLLSGINNLSFAVNSLGDNKNIYKTIKTNYPVSSPSSAPVQQKSHAPEPSSLFLILSGTVGMIVRFARRSFDKFKRVMDLFLSIAGLTLTSPLVTLAAVMIKLTSKGPVVYKQNRVGKNGEIFKIYKLRTMFLDAEKNTGAVWAQENDPRITPVGRILRKTHIDEIPQLLNVITGEMSIVGPRPERPEIVKDLKALIHDYENRLSVKPGITGLAQVKHKYDETIEDVKKKIKYDLLYIRKMCWLVEMRIIAQTFIVALTGKGAR